MNIDYGGIGAGIKYIRTQKGLSQEELAEFANVSPVYISNVERGEKSASLKVVIAVANALNVTTDSLVIDSLTSSRDSRSRLEFNVLCDCSKEENEILIKCKEALKEILRDYRISE